LSYFKESGKDSNLQTFDVTLANFPVNGLKRKSVTT
jgi:hypothetical protein